MAERAATVVPDDAPVVPVFFLSDSTGISAETMGNALLIQFPDARFERTLIPSGRRKPLAGHTLGVDVQDGKPVVVTTTKAKRDLTVQPLMSAAGRDRR